MALDAAMTIAYVATMSEQIDATRLTAVAWPTCAHCGAPVTSTAEAAAADMRTMAHVRNTHCMVCTNLAVCGAPCESCGHIPTGGPCAMEW